MQKNTNKETVARVITAKKKKYLKKIGESLARLDDKDLVFVHTNFLRRRLAKIKEITWTALENHLLLKGNPNLGSRFPFDLEIFVEEDNKKYGAWKMTFRRIDYQKTIDQYRREGRTFDSYSQARKQLDLCLDNLKDADDTDNFEYDEKDKELVAWIKLVHPFPTETDYLEDDGIEEYRKDLLGPILEKFVGFDTYQKPLSMDD